MVVPLIMAHWEDVAYNSLHYDILTVNVIDAKHASNPKKCCKELLKDWLSTDHGVVPKTWETLLKQLKEVPEVAASVEEISKRLARGTYHTICNSYVGSLYTSLLKSYEP